MICEQVRRDLDAYVDRELDATADANVRAHLGECAACRRLVGGRETLGRLVRAIPYTTASEALRAQVAAQQARTATLSARRFVGWAAAAAVVLVAVASAVLLVPRLRRERPTESDRIADARPVSAAGAVTDEAVDNHVRSLMASHLFDVQSTDQHTVKPWFHGKLDFSPPVVDLAAMGFPLIGGRLDYLAGQPVAALVYQRYQHTINVFVAPATRVGAADDETGTVRGFHSHHWLRGGMAFWAVSDLNEAELTEFVHALQAS
jgi:anti-sigma factor RsiW